MLDFFAKPLQYIIYADTTNLFYVKKKMLHVANTEIILCGSFPLKNTSINFQSLLLYAASQLISNINR